MAKYCPIKKERVMYLSCLECTDKTCTSESKTNKDIILSTHSMDSFSYRANTNMINTPLKMRELYKNSIEITRDEVIKLVCDDNIRKSINKKTKYYICDLHHGNKGIFVVRDNVCVTFKTTNDKYIWGPLNKN